MIKGVIFDLDGTLIDSIGDIAYSVNLTFKKLGYKETSEDLVRLNTGNGFKRLIQGLLPKINDNALIDEITKIYSGIYGEHYHERTKAYEGMYELLKDLQKMGIKIGANSNKKDEYSKVLMKKIFPDINFVSVYGEREGIKIKPDPYSAKEIVKNMNLSIDEVMYIGDSEVDIRTAKNGNFKSIACLWGFRKKEDIEKENPDYFATKASDIKEIIEKINKEETC